MDAADVPAVVNIHIHSFPTFFLTFLGSGFLRQLYAAIIEDSTGIAIVAKNEDGAIIGFVAGTLEPSGFYRRLIVHRLWRFARAAFMPLVRRPTILPRLLRALTMPQKSQAIGERTALLMSIAVSPDTQRSGVGRALNEAFLNEAFGRGSHRVILTTDRIDNDAANRFYRQQGFRLARTFVTPEGREMNEYEIAEREKV
jgi:ribosomal protein S18 acetylase RimI-like enzyme